jgi:AraC-like DNA-binding protein
MNRVSRNVDLVSNPFFFHYRKVSQGPLQVFHSHKGMEFMFVHEGAGSIVLEQEKASIVPDMLLCFMPFQLHKLVVDPRIPFVRSILIFNPPVLEPYLRVFPLLQTQFHQLSENPLFPHIMKPFQEAHLFQDSLSDFHLMTLKSNYQQLPEYFAAFMIGFLQKIHLLAPAQPLSATSKFGSALNHHHAHKIMKWIDEHFAEPFSLEMLSKELHLSAHHISHLFRNATGESISTYLTNRRIREVCYLLKTSSLPLRDIGRLVGMPNIPYLCTTFKRMMEMTPNKYRKVFESRMAEPDTLPNDAPDGRQN